MVVELKVSTNSLRVYFKQNLINEVTKLKEYNYVAIKLVCIAGVYIYIYMVDMTRFE